jgi:hypothetical protein
VSTPREAPREVTPPPVPLRTVTVVRWGMVAWLAVLVVILIVPSLREGDRSWWVWVPVSGIGLGLIGHTYLARGRGNAADA